MRGPLCLLLLSVAAQAQVPPGEAARRQGQFVRALTLLEADADSAAAQALDAVLEAEPDDPTVLAVRADAAARLGDAAGAVYFAQRAADAAPGRADAHLGLARALRLAGRLDRAAQALATARRLAPADLDVLLATVDVATEQNDLVTERDALGALVRIGDTVGARLRLSVLAERAGDRADAVAQAEAAGRLAPSEPAVARRLAEVAAQPERAAPGAAASGAALFERGRFAEAADALLAEIDADPRAVATWALALQALALTSDARAGATADDALLLFGSVPSVLAGAAEAYGAAGRTDDARATARRGLDALALLGDAVPDAPALRLRLDAVLSR